MMLKIAAIVLGIAVTTTTSVSAGTVLADRAECTQIASRVANMYSILQTGDLDLAMQVRDQTITEIRSLQAGERYQTAIASAAERFTTMSANNLQQFLIFECTH